MMLTLDQALIQLADLTAPGKTYSAQQLKSLAAQVTLDDTPTSRQGSVTLLYSGRINDVKSEEYIKRMIADGADIRVIDKTQVGQFLASDDFKQAFLKVSNESALYHGSTGPWAQASGRFVASTVGDVRLLGLSPGSGSVFASTELLTARLASSTVTSIEGIPIAELRAMSQSDALNKATGSQGNGVRSCNQAQGNGVRSCNQANPRLKSSHGKTLANRIPRWAVPRHLAG